VATVAPADAPPVVREVSALMLEFEPNSMLIVDRDMGDVMEPMIPTHN
jgi:hypothetical protein